MRNACQLPGGGSAPATPGFNAVAPEWFVFYGAAEAAPVIPAAESTLGSHPCVALSSAQVLPEWINRSLAVDAFASNGDYPLNFVSHSRGSLQDGGNADAGLRCRRAEPVASERSGGGAGAGNLRAVRGPWVVG